MKGKYADFYSWLGLQEGDRTNAGFIKKIKIKDGKIQIWTPKTPRKKPYKMNLNDENIKKIVNKLELQYKLLADEKNSQTVKKHLIDDKKKTVDFILFLIGMLLGLGSSFLMPISFSLGTTVLVIAVAPIFINEIIFKKMSQNFDEEIETIREFMLNISYIKGTEVNQPDENKEKSEAKPQTISPIEKYGSENTINKLRPKTQASYKELSKDNPEYIMLMTDAILSKRGKIGVEELRTLLDAIKTCKAMEDDATPVFGPNIKRTRKTEVPVATFELKS